jgi:hypothetical protein
MAIPEKKLTDGLSNQALIGSAAQDLNTRKLTQRKKPESGQYATAATCHRVRPAFNFYTYRLRLATTVVMLQCYKINSCLRPYLLGCAHFFFQICNYFDRQGLADGADRMTISIRSS